VTLYNCRGKSIKKGTNDHPRIEVPDPTFYKNERDAGFAYKDALLRQRPAEIEGECAFDEIGMSNDWLFNRRLGALINFIKPKAEIDDAEDGAHVATGSVPNPCEVESIRVTK